MKRDGQELQEQTTSPITPTIEPRGVTLRGLLFGAAAALVVGALLYAGVLIASMNAGGPM